MKCVGIVSKSRSGVMEVENCQRNEESMLLKKDVLKKQKQKKNIGKMK